MTSKLINTDSVTESFVISTRYSDGEYSHRWKVGESYRLVTSRSRLKFGTIWGE